MSPAFVKVEGLSDLDAALAQFPEAVSRKIALAALRRAAKPIVDEARTRARRQANPKRRGGVRIGSRMANKWRLTDKALADSIRAREDKNASNSSTEAYVAVGPDQGHFYGLFVELGTRASVGRDAQSRASYFRRSKRTGEIKIGWRRDRSARRSHAATRRFPFLKPSFEMHQDRVIDLAAQEMWKSIERFTRRVNQRQSGWVSGGDA